MTTAIALRVNDKPVSALVEPRQHLADFLREQLGLTGTHLGCEQGVCGACTVIIDGKPMRSCITYAVGCDGADIVTIEGLDNDALAQELREAFTAHHGLQCGFCTPGMLIAARDLILRHGECAETSIREELSGNLCRCTGYMGIVAAVKAASVGHRPQPRPAEHRVRVTSQPAGPADAISLQATKIELVPEPTPEPARETISKDGWTQLSHRVAVAVAPDAAWSLLQDIPRLARCLPGAQLDSFDGKILRGRMVVKFGPIKASFAGEGTVAIDQAARSGVLQGAGRDSGSGSQSHGEVVYRLLAISANTSEIEITLRYRITGMLAQFSRGALVRDLVARLTGIFAQNLAASVAQPEWTRPEAELGSLNLVWSTLIARLRSLLGYPPR